MADSVYSLLAKSGVTAHVVVPDLIQTMLRALEVDGDPQPRGEGITEGAVRLVGPLGVSPIPGFDFALVVPDDLPVPYRLRLAPTRQPTSFMFWLKLGDESHLGPYFDLVAGVPGFELTGAEKTTDENGLISLEAWPEGDDRHTPRLICHSPEPGTELTPSLVISGSGSEPAGIRFTPDTDSTEGVVELALQPSTVVFGDSQVGFELESLTLDDSETATAHFLDEPDTGQGPAIPSDDPARQPHWRGLLARGLSFVLPKDLPLFGGQEIRGYLAIGRGTGGVELVLDSHVQARDIEPKRPAYDVRIECRDQSATGLSGLVPTLISATMELPLDNAAGRFDTEHEGSQQVTFGAGKPVRATATLSRDPLISPDALRVVVGVSSQGADGLLAVRSQAPGDLGAKIFNLAAALAGTLIADQDIGRSAKVGDTAGVLLTGLLAVGAALSSMFEDDSSFVLHGVQVESSGRGAPVGDEVVLTLDYSVAVRVVKIAAGPLSVGMSPEAPMRIRVRQARLALDPHATRLGMVKLDFDRSTLEVEDPGHWDVNGLSQLFDVLRSRSGRGSMWFEVDLGFKVDLGPITVSGATVRITMNDHGVPEASIRGLRAGIDIPGAIEGEGGLRLLNKGPGQPGGFDADLRARVVPLNLGMFARLVYQPPLVVLDLAVDLPAPIPLANSGLGLLGVGALLGFSARPDYDHTPGSDEIRRQLLWDTPGNRQWAVARGQSSFGVGAAVGTLPDLGFTFSAKAGILITTPDVAVRGSLSGRVLRPPVRMSDPADDVGYGISYLGFLTVDRTALSFGVLGTIDLRPLLTVSLPISGHYPFAGDHRDVSDWYLYLGADGAPTQDRGGGPISATVLPDFVGARADAYLMVRGHGIADWPHHKPVLTVPDGLVIAFGFALQTTFGLRPLLWADLHASLDVLLGSKPMTLAGYGTAGGSLHLGPFSLGVDSAVTFLHAAGHTYFRAEVTGRVELLFFDIEGTVTIAFGDSEPPPLALLPPERHPLDRYDEHDARVGVLPSLTNDRYEVLAPLAEDPNATPAVWPDAIISLPFAVSPAIKDTAGAQFPGIQGPDAPPPPTRLGTEMLHYTWRLEELSLCDVTFEADKYGGPGVPVSGTLAARWQVPRSGGSIGSGAGAGDIAELLLFSTGPDLWVSRLADGGAQLPGGSPLLPGARICEPGPPDPDPGWALGLAARIEVPGYRLPPETVSADPMVCRVTARVHHAGVRLVDAELNTWDTVALDTVHTLPAPLRIEPAALLAWPEPYEAKHVFAGHLVPPVLHGLGAGDWTEGTYVGQQLTVELDEPITDAVLVLVVDEAVLTMTDVPVRFVVRAVPLDDPDHPIELAPQGGDTPWSQGPDPITIFWFRGPGTPIGSFTISYPLGARVGVAGVGGVTKSAAGAVARERGLRADEAARRRRAAHEGPPRPAPVDPLLPHQPGHPADLLPHGAATANVAHQRAILTPGRLYRIDVDMTWSGQLARQRPDGGTDVETVAFGDQPAQRRQLFFSTVPGANLATPPPPPTSPAFWDWLRGLGQPFHPEMLERYLAGYEPAQGEECRFRNDPLRVHFTADHVAALAAAYGYDLRVALRRVDRPGAEHAAPGYPQQSWGYLTNPDFLDPVDRERYDLAITSPCPTPPPGSTLGVEDPELAELAWYEVFAAALRGTQVQGRLPGITFRTSRWRVPAEMIAGLGFDVPGFTTGQVVNGDLEVSPSGMSGPTVVLDDDQAFDRSLTELGIAGWPPAQDVRLSRLWTTDESGGWRFAGLLLESPEPIHRPGRVGVDGIRARDWLGRAVEFAVRRRDRSGSRLLFLTPTPPAVGDFPPGSPAAVLFGATMLPELTLGATAVPEGALSGTLTLPTLPSFAGDSR